MNKYYKVEDVINCIADILAEEANMRGFKPQSPDYFKDKACGVLQDLPTIDIVHCGKCKYNGRGDCPMVWWDDSLQTLLNPCAADDFCSEGKMKDND